MRKYYVIFDIVTEDGAEGRSRAFFETDEPMGFEQIKTLEAQQAENNEFFDCKVVAFFPLESESY